MRISKYYRTLLRTGLNYRNRKALKNTDFSLLCNNCVGGVILHELGMRFNSPTVNLWMTPEDYMKFLRKLDYYLEQPVVEVKTDKNYPVGCVDDITIYFMHYASFDEATQKWRERTARINKENLYILFVEQDGCTKEMICNFQELPYVHKMVLVSKPMPDIECAYYIPNCEADNGGLIDICRYQSRSSGKRWLDQFDYVGFLNKKS